MLDECTAPASSGVTRFWDPGPNGHAGEPFFVAAGEGEGEGWLLTYAYDHGRGTSRLVILDALDITSVPVAEIDLPRRIPYGFHGVWVPD